MLCAGPEGGPAFARNPAERAECGMSTVTENPIWLSVDDRPDALESPLLRELFVYWRDKAAGRPAPRRVDIDPPMDLPRYLPTIILFDVERIAQPQGLERLGFRYRLVGTELGDTKERPLTGRRIDEVFGPDAMADDLAIYGRVVAECLCYSGSRQSMVQQRSHYEHYRRLVMPLLDDAGQRVDFLMIWIEFTSYGRAGY
jgi:hypothetical protein